MRTHDGLTWTYLGVGGLLLAWQAALWLGGRTFRVQVDVVRAHWVQGAVQASIFVYWGWFRPEVYPELPLIASQSFFLYAFGALVAWTRGIPWRIGFGPLPIVLSTNLLLWFQPDWYFLQFAMVATGALGKEFLRWERDGRRTHIFNPSVFGQVTFAVALIATGMTRECTLGTQIAASFEAVPHMHVLLFALGLVVQGLFGVTLMTFGATAALVLLNLAYTRATGTYYFMTVNIGATVFLGLHLLITDPSTTPRSNAGRLVFGAMYGLGYAFFYRLLGDHDVPLFWDKLLPVPILNLCVPLLDRVARSGLVGRLERRWTAALMPAALNRVHMGVWSALFVTLIATRFIDAPHEGSTLAFWKQAYAENRPRAGENLLRLASYQAETGDAEACDLMGMLHLEGELVPRSHEAAALYFERACVLGSDSGSRHVVTQYLVLGQVRTPAVLARAFDHLERMCAEGTDGTSYFLMGRAYETGSGRAQSLERALELYRQGCEAGSSNACKGVKRVEEALAEAGAARSE